MKYSHVLLTRFGKPADAFQIVEDNLPEPDEGQMRIKILAAHELFEHGQVQGKLILLPNA